MNVLLMRLMLLSLFLMPACVGLSSCVGRHYPRPESWQTAVTAGEAPCVGVAGTYNDLGSSSCEWSPPWFKSLSYILEPYLFYDFFPVRHLGKADRVEIRKSDDDWLKVFIYDAQGNPLYLSPGKGLKGKCTDGGILLSYKPRIDPREGIDLVSGNLFLSKGTDGSLICRMVEHRMFCSFIVPLPYLSTTYTVWYRFESRKVTSPARQESQRSHQRGNGFSAAGSNGRGP